MDVVGGEEGGILGIERRRGEEVCLLRESEGGGERLLV